MVEEYFEWRSSVEDTDLPELARGDLPGKLTCVRSLLRWMVQRSGLSELLWVAWVVQTVAAECADLVECANPAV